MNVKPEDQFQIGDEVIYLPEGVYAKVTGYVWKTTMVGGPMQIGMYELDCGVSTVKRHLARKK